MKKNFSLDVDQVNISPGTYKHVTVEFECEDFDILQDFKIEDILNIKNPDIYDILDHYTMEKVLSQYDIDDIIQYCRNQRLGDLLD